MKAEMSPFSLSYINYSHHDVHYSPTTYNWKLFIYLITGNLYLLTSFLQISLPSPPPLITTFSMFFFFF